MRAMRAMRALRAMRDMRARDVTAEIRPDHVAKFECIYCVAGDENDTETGGSSQEAWT